MSAIDRLTAALADRYTIERELGQGGMATVYLAHDIKHERQVAVKVLREDLSASLGGGRFLREIKIAAQLQHPNILPLLDSGEAAGFLYYVMPYVTGQSLRERIAREGELPVHEAVRLMTEVVDALAHAHEHGVVHRDIKPDNVMLSGRHALVADFGVAKAVSEATGRSNVTTLGVAVGTPTYMSPEQAAADPHIDHRSDIYAVGVMAYELLAGRPPFTGATPQQVLAAHVTEAPDLISKRRPGISPALEAAIMRCLAKRPADRFQTAGDLLTALEPLATPSGGMTPTHTRPVPGVKPLWRVPIIVGIGVVVVLAAGILLLSRRSAVTVTLGRAIQVTSDPGLEIQASISPDAKFVAYAAGVSAHTRIFVRPVAGGRNITLTDDTTSDQSQPRWSHDGSTILFLANGAVMTAPALGGQARPLIAPVAKAPVTTATWSSDGREVAFVRRDSLFARPVDGATTRVIGTRRALHSCTWSSRGMIACVSGNPDFGTPGPLFGNTAPSTIVVFPNGGGVLSPVTDSAKASVAPEWAPDGKSLYFVSNAEGTRDIYLVSVTGSGRAAGSAVRLTTGLNAASLSLSLDGSRLAYAVYTSKSNIWSLPIPGISAVSVSTATPVTSGSQTIEAMRCSRDGRWLIYDSNLRGNANIYRISLAGGEPERLTTDSADDFQPDISPDDKEITFHTTRRGTRDIAVMPLDGRPTQLVVATPMDERSPRYSPDGRSLVYFVREGTKAYTVTRGADDRWQEPVLRSDALTNPKWTPDGRGIVGARSDGGIAIVTLDGGAGSVPYAPRPGTTDPFAVLPDFSLDGRTIYFRSQTAEGRPALWSLPATGGVPRMIVRFDDPTRPSYRPEWAVDGKRIYFTISDRQSDVWVVEIAKK